MPGPFVVLAGHRPHESGQTIHESGSSRLGRMTVASPEFGVRTRSPTPIGTIGPTLPTHLHQPAFTTDPHARDVGALVAHLGSTRTRSGHAAPHVEDKRGS